jgi:hypothetical protein
MVPLVPTWALPGIVTVLALPMDALWEVAGAWGTPTNDHHLLLVVVAAAVAAANEVVGQV